MAARLMAVRLIAVRLMDRREVDSGKLIAEGKLIGERADARKTATQL